MGRPCIIDPEEVRIKDRLNNSGDNADGISMVGCEVSIDPVGDVKGSIGTKGKEIVRRDGLGLTRSLQQEELW